MHLAIFETEQEMKKVAAALPNQNRELRKHTLKII